MKTSCRFTKASIAGLACPADRPEVIFWDSGLKGFGLRCFGSGTRRYIVQYRTTDGTQRRERLGDPEVVGLDDARGRARELLASSPARWGSSGGTQGGPPSSPGVRTG